MVHPLWWNSSTMFVMNKSVGVWQAPDISMLEHTNVLVENVHNWSRKITFSTIKWYMSWKFLKCGIWHSLAYVLQVTNFTRAHANWTTKAIYPVALSSLGTNRELPTNHQYLPLQYFVLKKPHPYKEKVINRIKYWNRHNNTNKVAGNFLRSQLEQSQLETDVSTPVFQLPFKTYNCCSPTCGYVTSISSWINMGFLSKCMSRSA